MTLFLTILFYAAIASAILILALCVFLFCLLSVIPCGNQHGINP